MNISQLARNQQMMYNFINKSASGDYRTQMKSQLSNLGSLALQSKGDDEIAGMLQSMGISGLQGRTVREMAQYQMRVQKNTDAAAAKKASGTEKTSRTDAAKEKEKASRTDASTRTPNIRERYTPISDKATKAMQKLAIEDAKNSVKKKDAVGKTDAEKKAEEKKNAAERKKLIDEHLKDVDPSKRTAALNTMNKVWENETDRLGKYIKEKDKNWNDWGDEFDTSILDKYEPGVNVWV